MVFEKRLEGSYGRSEKGQEVWTRKESRSWRVFLRKWSSENWYGLLGRHKDGVEKERGFLVCVWWVPMRNVKRWNHLLHMNEWQQVLVPRAPHGGHWREGGNVPKVRLQGALNATPGSWLLWRTARSQELANFQDGIIELDLCSRRWWCGQVGPNLEATGQVLAQSCPVWRVCRGDRYLPLRKRKVMTSAWGARILAP